VGRGRRRRPCPRASRRAASAVVGHDCGGGGVTGVTGGTTTPRSRRWAGARVMPEAQVPPAAQRLRDDDGWAGARVIAEAEVPPAAQRLRDDDRAAITASLGALPGDGSARISSARGLLTGPSGSVVVGGRVNAFGCGAGVGGVAGWLSVNPYTAVASAPRASRRAASALLVTIAEAEVPPAAQRLRDHGGWAGARVIAEAEVPPAAQRLRNDDSAAITASLEALPGGGSARISSARGLLTGPPGPVVVGRE
jgi:uncharacterized protein YciI